MAEAGGFKTWEKLAWDAERILQDQKFALCFPTRKPQDEARITELDDKIDECIEKIKKAEKLFPQV